jgi:hypothetical protein
MSFAGAAALAAGGCGQDEPVSAAPAPTTTGAGIKPAALVSSEVCANADLFYQSPPPAPGDACNYGGAHGAVQAGTGAIKHAPYACKICHAIPGRLAFMKRIDPDTAAPLPGGAYGPAYGPSWTEGNPVPTFDATAKTCSNIACHTVPAGIPFSYYFPGGDGEPVLNTVYTVGNPSGTTPSWYATGSVGCGACHDNPPRNGSTGSNAWHSGAHGNQPPTGANNQCQLCHTNAVSTSGVATGFNTTGYCRADGTVINVVPPPGYVPPAGAVLCSTFKYHANGGVNVNARFVSACFGCH